MKRVKQSDQNNTIQPALIKPGLTSAWFNFIPPASAKRVAVAALAVMLMVISTFGLASNTFAAVKYSGLTVPEKASVYESALILQRCLVGKVGQTSETAVKGGNVLGETNGNRWTVWDKPIINYHQTLKSDDNVMSCSEYDNALVKGAINRLKIDPVDFICSMGGERRDFNECINGIGDFKFPSSDGSDNPHKFTDADLVKYLKDKVGIDLNNPGNEVRYWRSYNIVANYCASTQSVSKAVWDKENNNNRYTFNDPKTGEAKYYLASSKKDEKPKYKNTQQGDVNCGTYLDRVEQYYPAYTAYLKNLSPEDKEEENLATEDAQNPPATGSDATNCAIQGIGWIVCPVITVVAGITDSLYGWIQSFLVVQPLNLNTAASDNTTYIAWAGMRNLANVAFVIAFLIIIFSQLTGTGINNYGVKKMLPRLVVAAILVNISFWVCAIAVDVSNIIGNNIYNVLRNIGLGDITITDNIWETLFGWLLGGGTVAAAGFAAPLIAANAGPALTALLWAAVVFVLGALLALILAFIVLAARQALIIMFIVLSPLAFVAFLLPNTEKYFTLWRKTFTTLLIFYPLFSVLFGGSFLAGYIIIGSAGQADAEGTSGILVLLGMAVMVIPLFITPLMIKFSSGIMGTVAGMVNNRNKGLIDRAKNTRNRKAGLAMGEAMNNSNRSRNPFARVYRKMQTSTRGDADRKSNIENMNQAKYLESEAGKSFSTIAATSGQRVDAAKSENKATLDALNNKAGTENFRNNQRIENAGIKSTTQAGITNAAKEKRILDSPVLMNQIKQQDASKRESERHTAMQNQNVEANLSMASRAMGQQKANADLKTSVLKENAQLDIKRNQHASTDLRNDELKLAAIKKSSGVIDQQFQQTVAEAGSTEGGTLLVNRGYDQDAVNQIQIAQTQSAATSSATTSASNVQNQEYAQELTSNPVLAQQAGGIDRFGVSRVQASAAAVVRDVSNKAIEAEKGMMTQYTFDPHSTPSGQSVPGLWQVAMNIGTGPTGSPVIGAGSETRERQAAAAAKIISSGTDEQIYQLVDQVASIADPEAKQLVQEQIANIGGRKSIVMGAGAIETFRRGEFTGDFKTMAQDRLEAGKISADAVASANPDELTRIATILSNNPSLAAHPKVRLLKDQIAEYLNNDNNKRPTLEMLEKINNITSLIP